MATLNTKALRELIKARIAARIMRPVHIEGGPGLGKTEIPKQIAAELGIGFKIIHAPLLQPEDYGFPVIAAARDDVSFVVSRVKFPLESSDCPDFGILLIDELAQADNNAQKILRNVIQEREIHGIRLKAGWVIITTGNRVTDRAGANRLLSHMSNVLTRITVEPNIDNWTQWALSNGIAHELIAFLRFRPDLLNTFDPQAEVNATPRAWSQGVNATLGLDLPQELEFASYAGDVGEGPAGELLGFLQIFRTLPSTDEILASPDTAPIPKTSEVSTAYALCGALSRRASAENFAALMRYVQRLPAEFQALFVKMSSTHCPAITDTASFIQWASGPGAKLII